MDNAARKAALEVVSRCRRDGAWSAMALDAVIRNYDLDRRDAAFVSRLSLGVLQNSGYCDYCISLYCDKKLEPVLRDILRIGVYQLLFMDKIPTHAAVGETVSLCRSAGCACGAGLCNAVLRRIAEKRSAPPEVPGEGTSAYLSTRYSHPLWLVDRLIREHDYAFTEAFLDENNRAPKLNIQVNTLKIGVDDYLRALEREEIPFRTFASLPGCLELPGGSVAELPGYEEGLFFVQDRAARSAVQIAEPRPGMTVLDACSAPGGKSFSAAMLMRGEGRILSCDIHEKKLGLIRSGAERLGIPCIETQTRDARRFDESLAEGFDLVFADVPCSGLGVIGKRPEIRQKREEEIAALPAIQRAILDNVSRYVRPGGLLIYSTCTVLQAENRDVAEAFLGDNEDFTAEDFRLGDIRSSGGMYGFWPQIDGTDGFFAAKLRKKN